MMTKRVCEELNLGTETYDNYIVNRVLEGNNVLSKNDFANICKRKSTEKGYELFSGLTQKGWSCIIKDPAGNTTTLGTEQNNEADAVFEAFDKILDMVSAG